MNSTQSFKPLSFPENPFVHLVLSNPGERIYYADSNTKPISTTLSFTYGELNFQGKETTTSKQLTNTLTITNMNITYKFIADEIIVDVGHNSTIRLNEYLCASDILFDPDSGDVELFNSQPPWLSSRNDTSSVFIDYWFTAPTQTITITLTNAIDKGTPYSEITAKFMPNRAFGLSKVSVGTYGQDLEYWLPNRLPSKNTYVSFKEANVKSMTVFQPVGKISFANTELELTPSISMLDRRKLEIGDDSRSSYFLVFPRNNEDGNSIRYEISGHTSNVVWRDEQFVHTRWQELSSDVQAALIAAALGVCGWLILQVSRKWSEFFLFVNKKQDKKQNQEQPILPKCAVPIGHQVFVLLSGQRLAGIVKKEPRWYKRRYVLEDVYIQEKQDVWEKCSSAVNIDANKIVYTYIIWAKE